MSLQNSIVLINRRLLMYFFLNLKFLFNFKGVWLGHQYCCWYWRVTSESWTSLKLIFGLCLENFWFKIRMSKQLGCLRFKWIRPVKRFSLFWRRWSLNWNCSYLGINRLFSFLVVTYLKGMWCGLILPYGN